MKHCLTKWLFERALTFCTVGIIASAFATSCAPQTGSFKPNQALPNESGIQQEDLSDKSEAEAQDSIFGSSLESFSISLDSLNLMMPYSTHELISMVTNWKQYDYVDPGHLIDTQALKLALAHYDARKNNPSLKNKKFLSIIDFNKHNSKKRLYVINMISGQVETFLVAHGKGSDPTHTGFAKTFSNIDGTKMTSLGIYLTAEIYNSSKVGFALRLDGLENTNSLARPRGIVLHSADYVKDGIGTIGRSWGCPAVDHKFRNQIINEVQGGSLLFGYHKLYNP